MDTQRQTSTDKGDMRTRMEDRESMLHTMWRNEDILDTNKEENKGVHEITSVYNYVSVWIEIRTWHNHPPNAHVAHITTHEGVRPRVCALHNKGTRYTIHTYITKFDYDEKLSHANSTVTPYSLVSVFVGWGYDAMDPTECKKWGLIQLD